MAGENKKLLENVRDIVNPKITTIVEFDRPTTAYLAGAIAIALVLVLIAWAILRKMTNPV